MLKKKIEYTDFLGESRSKTLYFHISETRAQRMLINESTIDITENEDGERVDTEGVRNGLSARIRGVMDRGKGSEILELFDWLVSNAYGEIQDDGETFAQSKEIYEKWTNTASYDAFFTNLLTNTDAMVEFTNGIFPANLLEKAEAEDPEFKRHRENLASRGNPGV